MKKRSLDELLRTVFSAPWPAWKFLEESKGGTSCPVPQVNTLFKNQENAQSSSLLNVHIWKEWRLQTAGTKFTNLVIFLDNSKS